MYGIFIMDLILLWGLDLFFTDIIAVVRGLGGLSNITRNLAYVNNNPSVVLICYQNNY